MVETGNNNDHSSLGQENELYFDEFGQKAWPSGPLTFEKAEAKGRRSSSRTQENERTCAKGAAKAAPKANGANHLTMSNSQLTARFAELCAQV